MSKRLQGLRKAAIRRIGKLRFARQRADAWKAFRELPPERFVAVGSQAVHRARREVASAVVTPQRPETV